MEDRASRPWLNYGIALATVAVALLVSWVTPLKELSPTALFFAAVMVSSWYGGLGPGLVATALSTFVIDYFILSPTFVLIFDWGDLARIGVFVLEAILISWLNDTRKCLEQSLRQQNQDLVAAHRYKDQFLAALGHELRNPLAAISNGLQVLSHSQCDALSTQQVCEISKRQVRHLTRLIEDLMDLSRIAQGKVRLDKQTVELAGLVNQSVQVCRPFIDARRHELTVELPGQAIHVNVDPVRLQQVLVNLLHNAAKYTDPGGRIWLTVKLEEDEAVIRVRDTGVGMSPELLPKVFYLYTQSEHSLDRSEGGLGIGLSLVRSLVELHAGRVEARSAGLGQGSELIVRLPVSKWIGASEKITEAISDQRGPSIRILIVDDNEDAARMLAMLLEISGHDLHVTHDGPSTLEDAPDFQPDVVLLDIGLPGMDGYQVAERLRAMPGSENLILIALTGYGGEEDRRRSRQAGFDHHIVKPVDIDQLQQLLAKLPVAAGTVQS